jgi:hypothetical protein
MKVTPNTALQRTRAAALLQHVHGELSTSRRRRAPLSFETFGAAVFMPCPLRL